MTHSEAKTNRMLFFHSDDEEHHKPLKAKNPSEVASSQVEKVEKAGKQPSTKIPVKGMKGSLISTAISQLYLPDEYRGINGKIRDDGDKASVKTIGLKEKSGYILNKDASLPKADSFKSGVKAYIDQIVSNAKEKVSKELALTIAMPNATIVPNNSSAVDKLQMPNYENVENGSSVDAGSSAVNIRNDEELGKLSSPMDPQQKKDFQRVTNNDDRHGDILNPEEPSQKKGCNIKDVRSYVENIVIQAKERFLKEEKKAYIMPTVEMKQNFNYAVGSLKDINEGKGNSVTAGIGSSSLNMTADGNSGKTPSLKEPKQEAYIDLKGVQSYIGGIIIKAQKLVMKESDIAMPTAKILPSINSTVENLQKAHGVEGENAYDFDISIGPTAVANDVNHGYIAFSNESSQKMDFHMTNGSENRLENTLNQRKSNKTTDFNIKDVKIYIDHVIIQAKERFIKENEMATAIPSAKINPDLCLSVGSLKAPKDIHVESTITNAAGFNSSPVDNVSDRKTEYLPLLKKSHFDLSDVKAYVQDVILLAKKSITKEEEIAAAMSTGNKLPRISSTVVNAQMPRDIKRQNRKTIDTGFERSVFNMDGLGTRGKITIPLKSSQSTDFNIATFNESEHDTFQNPRPYVQKADITIKDVKSYIGHVVLQAKKQVMEEKLMITAAATTGKSENRKPTPVMNKANLDHNLTSGTEIDSSVEQFACIDKQNVTIENRLGSASENRTNDGEQGNIPTQILPLQEKHIQLEDVRSYVQQVIIQAQNKLIHENNNPIPMSCTEKNDSFGHSTVFNDILQPQTGALPKNVSNINGSTISTNVGSSPVDNDDIGKPENILAVGFRSSNIYTSQNQGNVETHGYRSQKTDFRLKDVKSYVEEIITRAQKKIIKEKSTTMAMPDAETIKNFRDSTEKLQERVRTSERIGNDIEADNKHMIGNSAKKRSKGNTRDTVELQIDIDKVVYYIKQLLTDDQKMAIYEYCRSNATSATEIDGGNRSYYIERMQLERNSIAIKSGIGSLTESIKSCIQQIIDDAKRNISIGNGMFTDKLKIVTNDNIGSSFDDKVKNPIENDITKHWRRSSAGDTGDMHLNNCDYLSLENYRRKEESYTERMCIKAENQIAEDNKLIFGTSGEGDKINLENMGNNEDNEESPYAKTLSQDIDQKSVKSFPMKIMKNVKSFHNRDGWSTQCTDDMSNLDSDPVATRHFVDDIDMVEEKADCAIQSNVGTGSVGELQLEKCTAEDDYPVGARISCEDLISDSHSTSYTMMFVPTSLQLKEGIPHSKTEVEISSCMENLLVGVERTRTEGNEVKHRNNYCAMTQTSSSCNTMNNVEENNPPISACTLNEYSSLDHKENDIVKGIHTIMALSRKENESSQLPTFLEDSRFSDNSTTETLCKPVKRCVPCIMDQNKDKVSPDGSRKRLEFPTTAKLPTLPCKPKESKHDRGKSKPTKLSDKEALSTLTRLPSKPTIMKTSVMASVKHAEPKERKQKMLIDKVDKLMETLPNPGNHFEMKHGNWKNRSQCKVNKVGEIVELRENMKQYHRQNRPVSVRKSAAMSVVQAMLMEKTDDHVQSGVSDDQVIRSSENGRRSDDIFPKSRLSAIHGENQQIEKKFGPVESADQDTYEKERIKSTCSPPPLPENDQSKCQQTSSIEKIEENLLTPILHMHQNEKSVKQYRQNTNRNEAKLSPEKQEETIVKQTDRESVKSSSGVSTGITERIPLESRQDSSPLQSQKSVKQYRQNTNRNEAKLSPEKQEETIVKQTDRESVKSSSGVSTGITERIPLESRQDSSPLQSQPNLTIICNDNQGTRAQTESQESADEKELPNSSIFLYDGQFISAIFIEGKKKRPSKSISNRRRKDSEQQTEHQDCTVLTGQKQGNGSIVNQETISHISQKSESSTLMVPKKLPSETNESGVSPRVNKSARKTKAIRQKEDIQSSESCPGKGPLPPIRNQITQDVKGEETIQSLPNRRLPIIVDNSIKNRPPWNASQKLRLEWEEARLKVEDFLSASKFSKYKPLPDISKSDGSKKTKIGQLNDIMGKDGKLKNRNTTLQKSSLLPSINTSGQIKELTGNTKITSKVERRPNYTDISSAKTSTRRRTAHTLSTSTFSNEIKYTGRDNENKVETGGSTGTNKNENNRTESRYTVPVSSLSYSGETVAFVSESAISSESSISLNNFMDVPSPRFISASSVSAVSSDSGTLTTSSRLDCAPRGKLILNPDNPFLGKYQANIYMPGVTDGYDEHKSSRDSKCDDELENMSQTSLDPAIRAARFPWRHNDVKDSDLPFLTPPLYSCSNRPRRIVESSFKGVSVVRLSDCGNIRLHKDKMGEKTVP